MFQHRSTGMDSVSFDDPHALGRLLLASPDFTCFWCGSWQQPRLSADLMHTLEDGAKGTFLRLIFSGSYIDQMSLHCDCLTTCCLKCWRVTLVTSRLGEPCQSRAVFLVNCTILSLLLCKLLSLESPN